MGLRPRPHPGECALEIMKWLELRDDVARVLHGSCAELSGHDVWKRIAGLREWRTSLSGLKVRGEVEDFKRKACFLSMAFPCLVSDYS